MPNLEKNKEYWENLTINGYRSPVEKHYSDPYTLYYPEFIQKFLQPTKEKILFEIGCGWGKQTKPFASLFGKVVASDISKTILNVAETNLIEFNNIIFCEFPNDLKKLDFKINSVFSYGVLQYCTDENIIEILSTIYPFISERGTFLFQFQMFDSIKINQKEINTNGRVDLMRNPHEIKALLNQTKFKMTGYTIVLYPALSVWAYGVINE